MGNVEPNNWKVRASIPVNGVHGWRLAVRIKVSVPLEMFRSSPVVRAVYKPAYVRLLAVGEIGHLVPERECVLPVHRTAKAADFVDHKPVSAVILAAGALFPVVQTQGSAIMAT